MFAHGTKVRVPEPGLDKNLRSVFSSLLHNHPYKFTGCTQMHRAFYLRELR